MKSLCHSFINGIIMCPGVFVLVMNYENLVCAFDTIVLTMRCCYLILKLRGMLIFQKLLMMTLHY